MGQEDEGEDGGFYLSDEIEVDPAEVPSALLVKHAVSMVGIARGYARFSKNRDEVLAEIGYYERVISAFLLNEPAQPDDFRHVVRCYNISQSLRDFPGQTMVELPLS